jgi:putative lipase involved disintegration of autophagic bodies
VNLCTLAIVLTASLFACGKDTSSSSASVDRHAPAAAAATERKPCDYVKRADAAKAVGLALPNTADDLTLHECRYMTSDFYGSGVTVGPWDGCKTALESSRSTTVANLGDEAHFIREHLFIRKGDRCLSVSINGPLPDADQDDGLARVKGLALTILPSL